jgi:glycosyltransferase involved in cell wall biosynthesis
VSRTCVIVSPYFPPSTLAGVHRARLLAKHLPASGWTPIIVCVDEAFHEERLDPGLAALVPSTVEIVKVRALSPRFCRALGFGEISLRAWRPLRRAVMRLLATREVNAVMVTGSPFYPMLLAKEIKRHFGVPVVLDFQDPWVSAYGMTQPRFSKAGAAHWLATLLEPKAVASADFITSVSETQNAEMRARYPNLTAGRMAAIPIGGDPEDYDGLRTMPAARGTFELDPIRFNLSYVGTIWPAVIDTLGALLKAVAEVRERRPDVYARLRLNFIGTTENPVSPDGCWARPLAEAAGVADVVREEPRRLPYLEGLSLQARSDAVLMLGSAEPHYTASKIYGVMMSGRPFLSAYHKLSSSHEILLRGRGGIPLGFEGASALPSLVGPLADAIVRLVTAPDTVGRVDSATYEDFLAKNVAGRYAAIFSELQEEQAIA